MINYEEAKKTALNKDNSVNSVLDYGDAYLFWDERKENDDGFVVIKETGKVIMFLDYINNRKSNTSPKKKSF